jgi:hypothetical protein
MTSSVVDGFIVLTRIAVWFATVSIFWTYDENEVASTIAYVAYYAVTFREIISGLCESVRRSPALGPRLLPLKLLATFIPAGLVVTAITTCSACFLDPYPDMSQGFRVLLGFNLFFLFLSIQRVYAVATLIIQLALSLIVSVICCCWYFDSPAEPPVDLTLFPSQPLSQLHVNPQYLPITCLCLDDISHVDLCRQLPCRHVWHTECIDQWLANHATCPTCRRSVHLDAILEPAAVVQPSIPDPTLEAHPSIPSLYPTLPLKPDYAENQV